MKPVGRRLEGQVWQAAAIAIVGILTMTTGAASAPAANTIVLGLVAEPTSMDPGQVTDINSIRVHKNLYDSLVRFADDSFDLRPALATSWNISADGLTYTFKLRQGVWFHDGTPFDAQAVKFEFDRMLDPISPYHSTGPFPFAGFFYGAIKETTVADPNTVVMRLDHPFAPLLNNLTEPIAGIVSPTAVKKWNKEFAQHPVGTGPFKFVAWEHNVRVVLERNADYWDGPPKLGRLIIRPIVDEQVRLTELLAGNVDVIADVPPDNVAQVKSTPDLVFLQTPGPHVWWVALNMTKAPFNDVRVRRAANYAVNKVAIVNDILKGTGAVSSGPIPPAIAWAYATPSETYAYNPSRAKQLLAEAGYPNGFSVVFWVTESGSGMQSPKTMAEAIQADLAAVGIKATIKTFEWGAYLNKYNTGLGQEADMAEMSWMLGSGDPDIILGPNLASAASSPAGFNTGHYTNAKVDQLLEEAKRITDRDKRGKLYQEVERLVAADAPWIFIDNAVQTGAMWKRVQGFRLHPSFIWNFAKASVAP